MTDITNNHFDDARARWTFARVFDFTGKMFRRYGEHRVNKLSRAALRGLHDHTLADTRR